MFRPIHFEIHADNLERAVEFYKTVFGWEIKKWDSKEMEYWMVMTAPEGDKSLGINGGIIKRKGPRPAPNACVNGFVCTMDVPSIDDHAKKILAAGGTEALPKFNIADMAWQAYYHDTEGNIFGIHEVIPKK